MSPRKASSGSMARPSSSGFIQQQQQQQEWDDAEGEQDQNQDQDQDEHDGPEKKKRKRNRAALSCTNCKSRKIKCSRQIPCEACIRRGVADACQWHTEDFVPPPQTFHLESTAEAVREHFDARISRLEALLDVQLRQMPPLSGSMSRSSGSGALSSAEVAHRANQAALGPQSAQRVGGPASARGGGTFTRHSSPSLPLLPSHTRGPSAAHAGQSSFTAEPFGELEEAAMSLEVMAGGDVCAQHFHGTQADPVETDTKPNDPDSLAAFAANSIIHRGSEYDAPPNPRLPFLPHASRLHIVEQTIHYLPDRRTCDSLLTLYFETLGWIFVNIFKPSFMREYEAFWALSARGERQFDPTWMAQLLSLLACSLQASPELQTPDFLPEDLQQLSRAALDLHDWRRNPNLRAISTLFIMTFYAHNDNDLATGSAILAEAVRSAMSLGLHQLGDSPSAMPAADPSCPPGSLLAREHAVRMWWELVVQDHMALNVGRPTIIAPTSFTTALMRNYTDEDLETGRWDLAPRPESEPTTSQLHQGKAATAIFVRRAFDEGPVPDDPTQIEAHFNRLYALEQEHLSATGTMVDKGSVLFGLPEGAMGKKINWRIFLGISGLSMRRCRLWRGYMVRGYADSRFAYATNACVESAQTVLDSLKKLDEQRAPIDMVWFITRHVLSAVTTLLIDAIHDVDVGQSSGHKLVNLPYARALFRRCENSKAKSAQLFGTKALMVCQALTDAKEARRRIKGKGTWSDYSAMLRNIATDVSSKTSPAMPPAYSPPIEYTPPSIDTPPGPTVNWLDDAETRRFLQSLGLMDGSPPSEPSTGTGTGGQSLQSVPAFASTPSDSTSAPNPASAAVAISGLDIPSYAGGLPLSNGTGNPFAQYGYETQAAPGASAAPTSSGPSAGGPMAGSQRESAPIASLWDPSTDLGQNFSVNMAMLEAFLKSTG